MGIRRRFSSLSGGPGLGRPAKSAASSSQFAAVTANSTPSLPLAKSQDENGNNNCDNGGIDLAANLEAYKQRCRALEAENDRLMSNQGKIIQDSNRRLNVNLEEKRQLQEQMDHQKKERLELLRWAQAMQGDCAKAKELAKEWQKVGRYSSKELHSTQTRKAQLESKCAKLASDNMDLKRLCLYLDKQRQTLWLQLAGRSANEVEGRSPVDNDQIGQRHHPRDGDDCGGPGNNSSSSSEDAGCGSSAATTPVGGAGGSTGSSPEVQVRNDSELDLGSQSQQQQQIQVDREQERALQSICSGMQSSLLLDHLEASQLEEPPHIVSPMILLTGVAGSQEPFEQVMLKRGPDANQSANSSVFSEYNCPAIDPAGHNLSMSSSSLGTTAQFGSSFCSSSDDTAILVWDEETTTSFHVFDSATAATDMAGLEVRELCTISEEEADEMDERSSKHEATQQRSQCRKLMERLCDKSDTLTLDGEQQNENQMVEELSTGEELVAATSFRWANAVGIYLSSSLLAQAGSMLVDEQQLQQMTKNAGFAVEDWEGGADSSPSGNAGTINRNSSASTGSSSSGAFSGSSGGSGASAVDGCERSSQLNMGLLGSAPAVDDDLPPEMPLIISELTRPPGQPSSCIPTNGALHPLPPFKKEQPTVQSSTLPRAAGNLPLRMVDNKKSNNRKLDRPSSVFGNHNTAAVCPPDYFSLISKISPRPRPQKKPLAVVQQEQEAQINKQTKVPPTVRIRVRPPPSTIQPAPQRTIENLNGNCGNHSLDRRPLHHSTPKMKADVTEL